MSRIDSSEYEKDLQKRDPNFYKLISSRYPDKLVREVTENGELMVQLCKEIIEARDEQAAKIYYQGFRLLVQPYSWMETIQELGDQGVQDGWEHAGYFSSVS